MSRTRSIALARTTLAVTWMSAVALAARAPGQELFDEPPPSDGPLSVAVPVSPPISERDLARYKARLAIDDDAGTVLESLYADYVQTYRDLDRTEIRALAESARLLTGAGPGFINTAFAEGYRDVMAARQRVLDRLAAIDAQFLDYVGALLPSEAQGELGRILLERRRVRANLDAAMLPAANVDLTEVMRTLDPAPERRATIDPVLADYEVAITPAMEDRFAGRVALAVSDNFTLARAFEDDSGQLYTPHTEEEVAYVRAILEERHATFRSQFQRNRRVRDLNARFLAMIEAGLDEADRRRVHDAFVARAYADLYPDPYSVHAIIDEALALAGLQPDQRAALEDVRPAVVPAYRSACEALEEQFVGWREFLANNMAYTPEAFQSQQEAMAAARRARLEASAMCAARIRSILRPDQVQALRSLPQLDHELAASSASTPTTRPPGSR